MSSKHTSWQGHQGVGVGFSAGSQPPGHQVGFWEERVRVHSRVDAEPCKYRTYRGPGAGVEGHLEDQVAEGRGPRVKGQRQGGQTVTPETIRVGFVPKQQDTFAEN